MTLEDLSDEDIVTCALTKEIRRLDDEVRKERQAKNEILGRYEKAIAAKQSLETRVALLEAELKRAKHVGAVCLDGEWVRTCCATSKKEQHMATCPTNPQNAAGSAFVEMGK